MLENTEGAITNGKSTETGNIGYTRRKQGTQDENRVHKTKTGYTRRKQETQKHNIICVGNHYAQTNTNNVNKTSALLQTTGGKDERPSSL